MQLLLNITLSSALFLLIGLSFTLIYYPTKFFNIAHGAVITLGAYFTFFFAKILFIPFFVSATIAIVLSISVGLLCEVLVYRPMRKKDSSPLTYFIASLGIYVILQNCISLFFGDDAKIINTMEVTVGHQILGAFITTIQLVTIGVSCLFFILTFLFLQFTIIGKSIRAVASNLELCNIFGISSNKTILIVFGISSALASSAGILSAMDTNMTPIFGFNLLLYGLVAMIIGGVGSIRGLIAGSLLVATAQHLSAYYIDTKWMDAVTYIILILFLIWKPLGFSGKQLKKVEV
jgi:branched-chain amino acid transport system permease protein